MDGWWWRRAAVMFPEWFISLVFFMFPWFCFFFEPFLMLLLLRFVQLPLRFAFAFAFAFVARAASILEIGDCTRMIPPRPSDIPFLLLLLFLGQFVSNVSRFGGLG
ncbi:uncharacterized protein B0H64DRAFT_384731 [Chaetomium fimeti]|uniref:Uncharacterized protein n=1 Tax=Chaetomium fimeti TaxID=1854472 RepID=A0AAE0HL89_9PEZI|nr:hypothetical protein B0H64DRAFT_384731 [Chaetomium fimeti]